MRDEDQGSGQEDSAGDALEHAEEEEGQQGGAGGAAEGGDRVEQARETQEPAIAEEVGQAMGERDGDGEGGSVERDGPAGFVGGGSEGAGEIGEGDAEAGAGPLLHAGGQREGEQGGVDALRHFWIARMMFRNRHTYLDRGDIHRFRYNVLADIIISID